MALRFLEVRLPHGVDEEVHGIAQSHEIIDQWHVPADDKEIHRFLMEADKVEGLMDALRSRFGDDARMVLMAVEATLPRTPQAEDVAPGRPVVTTPAPRPPAAKPDVEPSVVGDAVPIEGPEETVKVAPRVSREELYEDIGEGIRLNPVFLTMAAASAVVAAIGLVSNDLVAIIAAMVIAPLLGPNVGLALATTLGDIDLARRSLRSGLAGIGLSFAIAVGMGMILTVDPDGTQIATRTQPNLLAIGLAVASGVAGGLAFTSGLPASLIGVMVAVALLPPLATAGLLIGSGHIRESVGAFVLLGLNLVAVNLAGMVTFLAQGIRPVFHTDKQRASRAARRAVLAWTVLFLIFAGGVFWVRLST